MLAGREGKDGRGQGAVLGAALECGLRKVCVSAGAVCGQTGELLYGLCGSGGASCGEDEGQPDCEGGSRVSGPGDSGVPGGFGDVL